MGIIQLPRIYFEGFNYWTPSTYNNNDYGPPINTYDADNARLNWDYLYGQGVYNDEEFKKWSIIPLTTDIPTSGTPTAKSKDAVPPAEWGYYGGQQSGFVTPKAPIMMNPNFSKPGDFTHVTGYTNEKGKYLTQQSAPDESWINQSLQLNQDTGSPAKLVDINPASFWSSQVFLDSVSLGDTKVGFTGKTNNRMYSRWINPNHNYNVTNELIIAGSFSAVFQTCMNKDDVIFYGSGSKIQASLENAFNKKEVKGLMMRFTSYYTIYFQGTAFQNVKRNNPDQLYELMGEIAYLYKEYEKQLKLYQEGKLEKSPLRPINSAYSKLIGWVGLQTNNELSSAPGGRFLIPYGYKKSNSKGVNKPINLQPKGLPDSFYKPGLSNGNSTPPPSLKPLGPVAVELAYNSSSMAIERIAIDMCSAIPLEDISGKKVDYGKVQLALVTPDASKPLNSWERRIIADIPYDQRTYCRTSGILDIIPKGLSWKDVKATPLALIVEEYEPKTDQQTSVVGLLETPLTAQTDERGVYVNESNPSWQSNQKISAATVQVRYFGGKPPAGTTIKVIQYPGPGAPPSKASNQLTKTFYKKGRSFEPYGPNEQIAVRNGKITLGFESVQPGMPNISFEPQLRDGQYEGAPFTSTGIPSAFYTVIRVLPFQNALADEFGSWLNTTPDLRIVNERVFEEVFGTYHRMYPVMDFISDPLKFQQWRGRIMTLTDPANFEQARYMPVTRALSAGQRRIIELYITYIDTIHKSDLVKRAEVKIPDRFGKT